MKRYGLASSQVEGRMPVAEMFVSINGEGRNAGKLAAFIRFAGCNLSCSYCDTAWANQSDCPVEWWLPEELVGWACSAPADYVTLTGGEPLLQPMLPGLIKCLLNAGKHVEIETNGAVPLDSTMELREELALEDAFRLTITMDYKLPGSGMEAEMLTDNFAMLQQWDVAKFVAGSQEDLERMREVVSEHDLCSKCHVYLSPVAGKIDPADMVEFMKSELLTQVTLQLQLHKVIWPADKRGR